MTEERRSGPGQHPGPARQTTEADLDTATVAQGSDSGGRVWRCPRSGRIRRDDEVAMLRRGLPAEYGGTCRPDVDLRPSCRATRDHLKRCGLWGALSRDVLVEIVTGRWAA